MSPAEPPFAALSPNLMQRQLIAWTKSTPPRGFGRAMTSPARRLLVASVKSGIDVEVYGFKARLYPRDNLTDKRALTMPQLMDPAERAVLAERAKENFVFIDAGANTGIYSLFVATQCGPSARVLAIEPAPVVKDRLRFNIAANRLDAVITHLDVALAEGPGEAVLRVASDNRGESSLARSDGEAVTVPTLGLIDVMERYDVARADALKIDIEGAEDRVIPAFFAACPPERLPRLILMETTSKTWRMDCVAAAKAIGYRTALDTGRNVALTLD